jgi:hypothetical protein
MVEETFLIPSSYSTDSFLEIKIKTNSNTYQNPLLVLHGKSLPYYVNYDNKMDGKSFADCLVDNDVTCIMLNFLGFGKSSKYPEQQLPPNSPGSINTFTDCLRDIEDTLFWLAKNKNINKITVMGWSSSVISALMAAIRNRNLVTSVISYGLARSTSVPRTKTNYSIVNENLFVKRRCSDIPEEKLESIFPAHWQEQFRAELKRHAPIQALHGCPNDRLDILNNVKSLDDYLDWADVDFPIWFTDGVWDSDGEPMEKQKEYFDKCTSKFKKIYFMENSSHWIILETNRNEFAKEIKKFMEETKNGLN